MAAGQAAVRLVSPNAPRVEALFASAVLAESQNDAQAAEQRYRDIAALQQDASEGQLDLAGFLKRQDRNEQAVNAYHEALRREPGIIRAHVELCQLYSAVDDYPLSEQHAQTALKNFRVVQNRGGEAQSLLCYGDALVQPGNRLKEARQHIDDARDIFPSLTYPYGLSRVFQYLGYLAGRERTTRPPRRPFKRRAVSQPPDRQPADRGPVLEPRRGARVDRIRPRPSASISKAGTCIRRSATSEAQPSRK